MSGAAGSTTRIRTASPSYLPPVTRPDSGSAHQRRRTRVLGAVVTPTRHVDSLSVTMGITSRLRGIGASGEINLACREADSNVGQERLEECLAIVLVSGGRRGEVQAGERREEDGHLHQPERQRQVRSGTACPGCFDAPSPSHESITLESMASAPSAISTQNTSTLSTRICSSCATNSTSVMFARSLRPSGSASIGVPGDRLGEWSATHHAGEVVDLVARHLVDHLLQLLVEAGRHEQHAEQRRTARTTSHSRQRGSAVGDLPHLGGEEREDDDEHQQRQRLGGHPADRAQLGDAPCAGPTRGSSRRRPTRRAA